MASKNRIDYIIDFNVNKSSFSEINKYLDAIRASAEKNVSLGGFNKDLETANEQAKILKNIMSEAWNIKLNQLDLNKVNEGLKKNNLTVDQLRQSFNKIGPEGAMAFNAWSSSILRTNMQLKQSSKLLDDMATTFKNTVRYGISSSIFNNLSNGIQKAFNYTKQLDTSLNDIRIITGYSAEEMEKFAVSANRVAKDLGKSTKDFTEASLIYYQQGLGAEEAQARAEVTLKAANVTGQTGKEVSEQLTAVWNGYKVTSEEAELYVDKLAAVAAATAADLEELSTGMSKVASAANIMGVDIDQLNAQLATIVSATRQAPESVGVALKTIYARMSDIKSGLDDETTLGNYTEKMAQYGVNVLDANGNLRDMGDVIEEIGNKWESLSREQQVALSQVMAGTRQYNNLLSLFDNWNKYQKAMEVSTNAAGTLQKQQDIYMESTEAHLQKIRTEAERTYDILFDTDTVNGFADAISNVLSIFNDFLEGIGGGTNAFIFFGSTIANIFSKQIGSSINRQIENIKVMEANAAAASLKAEAYTTSQLGIDIKNERAANGENIGDVALKEEVEWAKQLLQIRGTLTNEKYAELTNVQKELGVLKEQIEYYNQYDKIEKEIFGNKSASIVMWETELEKEQQSLNDIADKKKYTELILKDSQRNVELTEEEVIEMQQRLDLLKSYTNSEEQLNNIEAAKSDLMNKNEESQKHIQSVIEAQNREYEEQYNKVNKIKQGLEGRKITAQEAYALEQQYIKAKDYEKAEIAKGIQEQQMQNGIKGLTAMISLTTTLSGIVKTIGNDSLSDWEKFEKVSLTVIAVLPQLIASLKYVKDIIPMVALGFTKLGDSLALAASEMLGFEVAAAPVLITLGAIVAIVAAIGIAVYEYSKKQNEANKNLERATVAAEKATKAFQETKEAYENLQSSIEKYHGAEKALKSMVRNTTEWKEQVIELNDVVLSLLDKYPELASYITRDENGIMKISSKGFDEIIKKQQQETQFAQAYQSQAKAGQIRAQIKVDTKDLKDNFKDVTFSKMSDEDVQKIASIVTNNQEIISNGSIEEISKLLEDNGIDFSKYTELNGNVNELIRNIISSKDLLIEFDTSLNGYTQQIGLYTNNIAQAIGMNNPDYQKSENKNLIDKDMEKIVDETYKKRLEELNNMSFDQIASYYEAAFGKEGRDNQTRWTLAQEKGWFGQEQGFYMGSRKDENFVSLETAKEKLATKYAENVGSLQIEKITKQYDTAMKTLNEGYDGFGNFVKATKEGKDLRELYTLEELKKLRDTYNNEEKNNQKNFYENIFGKGTFKNLGSQLSESISKYYDRQDYSSYYKKAQASLDSAEKDQGLLDVLSKGDPSKLDKEQKAYLEELEQKYTELGNIQDKTSHEYLVALREIKEQEEDNANTALKQAKEIQEGQLKNLYKELDELNKDPEKNAVEITAKTDEIDKILDQLEETDRTIKVKIDADLQSDVDDAFGLAHELDQLRDVVTEDLTYTYDEAKELIEQGYGEMFTNAQKTADGVIKVNKSVRDAFIDDKQSELSADKTAKIKQLQNQREMLISQRNILNQKLTALEAAANAETETDAQTALAKVAQLEGQYQAEVDKMNETLTGKGKEAEEKEKIDAELYNSLGGMYDKDVENQKNAEKAAADNDKANVDIRIKNARALHQAWQSVAKQVKLSASGETTEFSAGSTSGGTNAGGSKSQTISGTGSYNVNSIDATKLDLSKFITDGKTNSTYKATINALISSTKKQINSIDGQIGSIDAGIAALQSADLSLDKKQASTGKNKKGKSGGGKGNKGKNGKDPNKIDAIENEEDRYHQVDVQLKLIENDLKKLDRAKEKAFGENKLKILNKELEKYEKQIDTINDKIAIAFDEAFGLRKSLSSKGVKFGADGSVSNYVAAIQAQENAVNKVINKYNKMSAEQQEKYKDTVEQEKKNFEDFKKDIDRYDELISNTIPELRENIQDAIDKQIDIQIEEFDMEIELRLNLKEAQQDWNTFLKEVEKDFDKNNPIGDLFKDYEDLKTLLADNNKGLSQALGRQLQNTLDELYKMDEGKNSDVYGADRVKALEDLKKYLDESISALEEIEDLEDSIHEDFIKNMDAIQDRFDKQIEDYETISKLLDHDKEIIELVSGDNAYKQLAQFYDKQEDNYKKQLAFQNQQVIFWREQLDSLDKSSDEWEDARKKWADAVEEYNDLIEDSIENLQDKYLNTIKDIFNDLNNKLSSGRGLEGMNDQWKLLNLESEEYLDNVNAIYQTQQLANKYLDAIDNTSNVKAQQRLREIMDDELDNLRQRDKLSEYDLQRAELRYQIAVKQIALEEAQQNKSKMRLRRDTQGNYRYEYVADNEQLNKSKQEISDFYNQLYNLDAKKYSENLDKVYNLTKEAEDKIQELYEDTTLSNEERQERILETTQYYGELIDQLTADNEVIKQNLNESTMSELFDLYDINKDNYAEMTNIQQDLLNKYLADSENLTNAAYDNLFGLYNQNVENFKNMTNEELDVLMEELIPGWDSAYQTMIDNLYAEGGFVSATKDAYAQAGVAAEEYYNKVIELSNQSDDATKHAIDTINEKREADEEALKIVNEQMKKGKEYLKYLEDLIKVKEEDIKKTKEQTEAAYKYWQEQQRQAADAAQKEAEKKKEEAAKKAEENKKSTSTKTSTTSNGSKSSSNGSGGGKGDGKLSIGDTATYTGKYYYDSRGAAPAGSRYSGVKNGIIIDKINSNAYGIHIKSADGKYSDLGWVKKSQLSGYDTGGYTGSWGKDGRLALLHQKELVLNSTDTQNMLDAVKIIRQITDSLGSTILGRLADIGSAGMGNLVTGSNSIDQNVHIEANFPNVTKHDEIEQALNNLVNAAAHRVNKKI